MAAGKTTVYALAGIACRGYPWADLSWRGDALPVPSPGRSPERDAIFFGRFRLASHCLAKTSSWARSQAATRAPLRRTHRSKKLLIFAGKDFSDADDESQNYARVTTLPPSCISERTCQVSTARRQMSMVAQVRLVCHELRFDLPSLQAALMSSL